MSGRHAFGAGGYAGSRLADITKDAGLTTGAFYRHFANKWDFFVVLYEQYGAALLEALEAEASVHAQAVAWLLAAREHRGVVRASQELAHDGSQHLEAAEAFRDAAAALIAKRLHRSAMGGRRAPGASLMIVDMLSQYAFMEAAEWVPRRDPATVALQLERLVERGLYS